jgi:hypothetical protein
VVVVVMVRTMMILIRVLKVCVSTLLYGCFI